MGMQIDDVIFKLDQLGADDTIPRSVRKKLRDESNVLKEDGMELNVKVNRLLAVLDELSTNPSVSSDIRAQIWYLVSILESMWRFIEKLIN